MKLCLLYAFWSQRNAKVLLLAAFEKPEIIISNLTTFWAPFYKLTANQTFFIKAKKLLEFNFLFA